MRLINELNIRKPSLNTLVTKCGVGKTTLSCILTSEFVKEGHDVLFLSYDMSEKSIIRKLVNVFGFNSYPKNVRVKSFGYKTTNSEVERLEKYIDNVFKEKHYNVIIIDGGSPREDFILGCNNIVMKYNCIIVRTEQAATIMDDSFFLQMGANQISDLVFGLANGVKLTRGERIKYFLCFWLKKPTHTLSVLKNRFGKTSSTKIFIDFDKISVR